MMHTQHRMFWRYLHMFSGFISVPLVFCVIAIGIIRLSNHNQATKGIKQKPRPSSLSFRGKTLEDLNPIYTEQSIYDGVLPGTVAFLVFLEAMIWFEMAFRMGPWTPENLPQWSEDHVEHEFLAMVIGDIFVTCIVLAFVSIAARILDRSANEHTDKDENDERVNAHAI